MQAFGCNIGVLGLLSRFPPKVSAVPSQRELFKYSDNFHIRIRLEDRD
jgi:hypothetical protein